MIVLFASMARADDGPTVHEYVPDLEADEGMLLVSSGGAQPDAIVYQGEILPPPEMGRLDPGNEEPMRASPGDGQHGEEPGRRSPSFRPDRVTDLQGTVGYYTVFTPTIAPYKRISALDRITIADDGTPILGIADPARRPMTIVGANAASENGLPRDRFWGSVVLDFEEGSVVPLPSVSPESRMLTLETDPPTPIEISRDGAQNFYARPLADSARQVRVVFLTDAPRSYFGRSIPDGPVDVHASHFPPVPASVQRDALAFASELGLSRRSTFREALRALTGHFRSFAESREPPRDTGNIYLDLSRGRRGICRHRAYGFVITAQTLGMHARFVQNEAHAWVEVELPADAGWLRVDLGGAATGLEARGAQDRPVYSPDVEDDLPRPREYAEAYEQARRMSGLRPSDADSSGPGTGRGPGVGSADRSLSAGPGSSARGGLALTLDVRRHEVFRGRELEVTGRAEGGGVGVVGLRVEVFLRAPATDREWLLGVTVTNEQGRFRALFGVPPDLAVGDYELVVRTPGDPTWGPAIAR